MHELVVLFLYHQDDAVTRTHHELLVRHNPGVPVVPVVDGKPSFLPGTIDVGGEPWHWGADRDSWANCDTIPYRWFLGPHRIESERYVAVEYDVRATMPLRDFLAQAWQADLATAFVATPPDSPGWAWWSQVDQLGDLAGHATGAAPLAVTLYSRRGLEVLSAGRLACFSELRVGTQARASGLDLRAFPDPGGVRFLESDIGPVPGPGIWHPVKRRDPAHPSTI